MKSAGAALEWMCSSASQVSAHYLICESGRLFRLVPERFRAWHAGVSHWQGETDLNSHSIGIEIANGGHDFGCPSYPAVQIDALIGLLTRLLERYQLAPHSVLAHSDIAPTRKRDPGEWFPWQRLADHGLCAWMDPESAAIAPARALHPLCQRGDSGTVVMHMQKSLRATGFDVPCDGTFDLQTESALVAFQRRHRPDRIVHHLDCQTRALLGVWLNRSVGNHR